jgi:Subtilase family
VTSNAELPFPVPRHAHLRLSDAVTPGARHRPQRFFGGAPAHKDRGRHADEIHKQAMRVIAAQQRRVAVLGVKPELVLVLESNRQIAPEDVEAAGLQILEMRTDKILVTFASDPEMSEFLSRCDQYGLGPRGETPKGYERPAQYESLFDAVEAARQLTEEDIVDVSVTTLLTEAQRVLRLDVSCWCPDDADAARHRFDEVKLAVAAAGGDVLDSVLRWEAGLSLIRAELPASAVHDLATLDRVRRIVALPEPHLTHPAVLGALPTDLPEVSRPAPDGPVLGVIDSGIASSHPLLAPAVLGAEWVGSLGDGGDGFGHGTLVASLALYGSLEKLLANPAEPARPCGRLVSVRILDDQGHLVDDRLWETQLIEAMEIALQSGAKVINLSLGDPRRPYQGPRPTELGAVIDQFIRSHKVVVTISAGNYTPWDGQISELTTENYPKTLLETSDSGLLDPAPAALALTVGALCPDHGQGAKPSTERIDVIPIGGPDKPSPLTRAGPGPMGMVKPELVAPGGSLSVDLLTSRVDMHDPSTQVIGAGIAGTSNLLAADAGTSCAAPLVSNAALRILGRYPQLSANTVRALLLCSAEKTETVIEGLTDAKNREQQRRLTGYGRVSAERAEVSEDHRAVLVAESEITIDDVHLYTVPIPLTFFSPGGYRRMTVALAYDPPVRATRLDYLASHMEIHAYHGASLQQVRNAYTHPQENEDEEPVELREFRLDLQPSSARRGKGTHQLGAKTFHRPLDHTKADQFIIAVKNTNRWDTPGTQQAYALAVVLERDRGHTPLYAELRAKLELIAEIEAEVET